MKPDLPTRVVGRAIDDIIYLETDDGGDGEVRILLDDGTILSINSHNSKGVIMYVEVYGEVEDGCTIDS